MRLNRAVFCFVLPCLCAGFAMADTLSVYEGFNYLSGASINGQNGGLGWSGSWTTPGGLDATIASGSLGFGSLSVIGGSLTTAGSQPANQGSSVATWNRSFGTNVGADNTTVYLSYLLRPDAGAGFYGGLNFGGVFIGLSGNQSFYGLEGAGNDISLSSVAASAGQAVLFVLRVDFLAGNDTLSLYVNPGSSQPALASVVKTNLDLGIVSGLTVNNYGGFTTDEIRIGDSFAAVTPADLAAVPEPAYGFGVMLISLALISGRINRSRG